MKPKKPKLHAVETAETKPPTDTAVRSFTDDEVFEIVSLAFAGGEGERSAIVEEGIRALSSEIRTIKQAARTTDYDLDDITADLDKVHFRACALAQFATTVRKRRLVSK